MIKLALLWHMHQPYYEDLATGEHILPWARLHAIKDYWGMVAMLRQFPEMRVTFNLVPSLLVQIEAFAGDSAADRHLHVGMKSADALDIEERQFLVANGFHAPVERMIKPCPRYAALYAARQNPETFTVGELRDLQVLHKLVWMDPDWRESDGRLRTLVAKGRDFTEADKATLRAVELELLNLVVPAYRQAAATGTVELTTSPYYHPILPLLCDTDVHLRAHPGSALPRGLFARPEDAREQLTRALAYHAHIFGAPPQGVWPSEGSLSDDVVRLFADEGIAWTATDEEILARSLGRALTAADLYRPYELGTGGRTVRALFRDHALSDLIGFVYQSWDADAASADFVAKVRTAAARFRDAGGGEDPVVTVILDGENAWEHYDGGGRPFLRALYEKLSSAADIETVTMSEAVAGPALSLPRLFPGSWINGDFYIWAGHRDDHRAWGQLADARRAYDARVDHVQDQARRRAREELLIAEGSDWFWWYGDDHSSNHDREFDDLFRRHVRNVYSALGETPPGELYRSNITTASRAETPVPIGVLSSPALDGRAADFTQWVAAFDVPLLSRGGAMHRVAGGLVARLLIAADRQYLYIRLDGAGMVSQVRAGSLGVAILQERPQAQRIDVISTPEGPRRVPPRYDPGPRARAEDIVTLAVPFTSLGVSAGDAVMFSVAVIDTDDRVVEQHPGDGPLLVVVPTDRHDAGQWLV